MRGGRSAPELVMGEGRLVSPVWRRIAKAGEQVGSEGEHYRGHRRGGRHNTEFVRG
jgi:hypothetical protein